MNYEGCEGEPEIEIFVILGVRRDDDLRAVPEFAGCVQESAYCTQSRLGKALHVGRQQPEKRDRTMTTRLSAMLVSRQ
jgi:hypothetical protein